VIAIARDFVIVQSFKCTTGLAFSSVHQDAARALFFVDAAPVIVLRHIGLIARHSPIQASALAAELDAAVVIAQLLHSARSTKLPNDCLLMRNSLCVNLAFSVSHDQPSRTFHKRGSPSSRRGSLPLNSVRKPSSANARGTTTKAAAQTFSRSQLPFNFNDRIWTSFFGRSCAPRGTAENLFHHVVALRRLRRTRCACYPATASPPPSEKLAAVAVGPALARRGFRVWCVQVGMKLVGELVSRPAAARPLGASALNHKIRNDAMKDKAVVKGLCRFFRPRPADKIFDRLRRPVGKQANFECSFRGIEIAKHIIRHEGDSNSTGDGGGNERSASNPKRA